MTIPLDPVFPQEVFDSIIDQLFNDKETLVIASLVCRAWSQICRYRLFCEVTLREQNWARFLEFQQHYACRVLISSETPLDKLAQHTFPQITSLFLDGWGSARDTPTTTPTTTTTTTTAGSNSAKIELGAMKIETLSRIFPKLLILEIRNCRVRFDAVHTLLHLHTLTWECGHRYHHPGRGASHHRYGLPPGLRTLNVHVSDDDVLPFLSWCNGLEPLPELATVRLLKISSHHMESLAVFLRKLGKSLRHLELTFASAYFRLQLQSVTIFTSLDFSCIPSLHSFVMQEGSPEFYQQYLCACLQATSTECITLSASEFTLERRRSVWLSIDQMIIDSLAAKPRSNFTLQICVGGVPREDGKELVRSSLPLCSALGIVAFIHRSGTLEMHFLLDRA